MMEWGPDVFGASLSLLKKELMALWTLTKFTVCVVMLACCFW